VKWISNLFI